MKNKLQIYNFVYLILAKPLMHTQLSYNLYELNLIVILQIN
jgi:hypothetical protein